MVVQTVTRKQLSTISMVNGNEHKFSVVIMDGQVKEWVGIGWIDVGPPTEDQKVSLPHVID